MTQVFYASRFFGAMTLAAGIDAGVFGPPDRERVLIVTNNDAIPEIALPLDETPGSTRCATASPGSSRGTR